MFVDIVLTKRSAARTLDTLRNIAGWSAENNEIKPRMAGNSWTPISESREKEESS